MCSGGLARFSWLSRHARPFPISGGNVKILYNPEDYFNALKRGIQTAKTRIMMSSLYLGTGNRETELVDALREALSDASRPDLTCVLLLDYLRGSRGDHNSRSMLRDLVAQFGPRFQLCLYHTPNLRGLLRWAGPERFNEVMGLQHMKVYLSDDDLLISGANLNRDYFIARQDRYVQFSHCAVLADYFSYLLTAVVAHSFTLTPHGDTVPPRAIGVNPLSSRKAANEYRTSLYEAVRPLAGPQMDAVDESRPEPELPSGGDLDTIVFPLLQMGYYGIRQEEAVTREILVHVEEGEKVYLASGYFNLPPQYVQSLMQAKGEFDVLAASPQANGFYGGKGVAGHVPYMYIHFAKQFLRQLSQHHCTERVKYREYFREGWTFHGKGLWYYLSGEELPSLSLVGSSNYGHRSLTRDLEVQLAVVTTNMTLRRALHEVHCACAEFTLSIAWFFRVSF